MKFKIFSTLLLMVVLTTISQSQDRYLTRSGAVKFFSTAPMEDIEAHTNKALSILDIKKGDVAVTILIKSFEFEKKLMQEHFNENYMESDKYPKATFTGKFETNDNITGLVDGTYELVAKGELSIHGKKQQIESPVTLTIKNQQISADLIFMANVKEFGIKIPKVVVKNIAEEVEVTAKFEYEVYK